ncbi:MAG: glycosyl transferase family 28 [Microbacteriaceae bacterium]|nr:glycosyl transferase family 28 [Microbacteriaceae bacterium]
MYPPPKEPIIASALLACSGGGHLKELFDLAPRLGIAAEDQVWLTFDNGLSRSLLRDREVIFVPYVNPRSVMGTIGIHRTARRLLASREFDIAVSTGSIPGLASLPHFAARGVPSHFIESAARSLSPSLAGRLIARFPRVKTYTQYPHLANDRWKYRGSVFDEFEGNDSRMPVGSIRKAVVTVGTTVGYPFDRLFARIAPLLADCDEVLWQVGDQDVSRFGIEGRDNVPHSEMQAAIAEADVVIAHCGTGSALTAFEAGKFPILVPRWQQYGEHIDDHQIQIGRELERRGLASLCEADQIDASDLFSAASRSVNRVEAQPFTLD